MQATPEKFVGQTLDWRLQIIAVQLADELRPEMPSGQPYLLTRGPLPEAGFVYVMIPPDRVAEFRALPALHEMTLRVTLKAARTRYLATPVAELVATRVWPGQEDEPMNDLLKQRIARALDALSDDRGYQILDYIEFLESKYAERARPGGIFAKLTETVEDTMRAGKLPIQAISGTMGLVDGAAKVMKGLAAAGQAVMDEAVKAAEDATKRPPTVTPPIELDTDSRKLSP